MGLIYFYILLIKEEDSGSNLELLKESMQTTLNETRALIDRQFSAKCTVKFIVVSVEGGKAHVSNLA